LRIVDSNGTLFPQFRVMSQHEAFFARKTDKKPISNNCDTD
jgi:hypothetical protein